MSEEKTIIKLGHRPDIDWWEKTVLPVEEKRVEHKWPTALTPLTCSGTALYDPPRFTENQIVTINGVFFGRAKNVKSTNDETTFDFIPMTTLDAIRAFGVGLHTYTGRDENNDSLHAACEALEAQGLATKKQLGPDHYLWKVRDANATQSE